MSFKLTSKEQDDLRREMFKLPLDKQLEFQEKLNGMVNESIVRENKARELSCIIYNTNVKREYRLMIEKEEQMRHELEPIIKIVSSAIQDSKNPTG
jgi:hypothetical protein